MNPHEPMAEDRLFVPLAAGIESGDGVRHRDCVLRRARVRDELRAVADFRARLEPERLSLLLLARTVERIGAIEKPGVEVLERLDPSDRRLLEKAYAALNGYLERADS